MLDGFIPTTEISGRLTALAYEYVLAGGVVRGPGLDGTPDGSDISLKDILAQDKNGQLRPNEATFFRLYTPLRQDLMPTYDFLEPPGSTTLTNVNDDPSIGSTVSQTLNGFSPARRQSLGRQRSGIPNHRHDGPGRSPGNPGRALRFRE